MYVTKGKLEVKLTHSDLRGELADRRREVQLFWDSIHLFQSGGRDEPAYDALLQNTRARPGLPAAG